MKTWYEKFSAVPPEPQTHDEGQPMDPAALPSGGFQVRPVQRCFNLEDDDEADTPTDSEEPALHLTDSASEAASLAPASQSAATPTTGTNNA